MNTIGIDRNLDRGRIRKLLAVGLLGAMLTGSGDFILGFAVPAEVGGGPFDAMLVTAPNMADWQMIAGGLLGFVGLFIEALGYFGIYRLMADAAPHHAHVLRAFIFGYIWTAPVACHMNVGVFSMAYKYLFAVSPDAAHEMIAPMYLAFGIPAFVILGIFWIPAIAAQFQAFSRGLTPYPAYAKWFNLFTGAIPVLAIGMLIGADSAWGGGIGTMFLCAGNAVVFGGLLATMPNERRFREFEQSVRNRPDSADDALLMGYTA